MLLVLLKTQQRIMIAPTKNIIPTQYNEHTSLVIRHGNDATGTAQDISQAQRRITVVPSSFGLQKPPHIPTQYNEHKTLVGRMRRGTRRNPAMKVEAKNET